MVIILIWKLASILKGQAGTELIKTYTLDRGKVAADLIPIDRSRKCSRLEPASIVISISASSLSKLEGKQRV
jgi:FAD binding domain